TDVIAFTPADKNEVLSLAAGVEAGSNHPLAQAIVSRAQAKVLAIPAAHNAFASPGKAVHAEVNGLRLAVSSPLYAANAASLFKEQRAQIEALQHDGKTVSVLLDEQAGIALGLVALRDEPRQDAR